MSLLSNCQNNIILQYVCYKNYLNGYKNKKTLLHMHWKYGIFMYSNRQGA